MDSVTYVSSRKHRMEGPSSLLPRWVWEWGHSCGQVVLQKRKWSGWSVHGQRTVNSDSRWLDCSHFYILEARAHGRQKHRKPARTQLPRLRAEMQSWSLTRVIWWSISEFLSDALLPEGRLIPQIWDEADPTQRPSKASEGGLQK